MTPQAIGPIPLTLRCGAAERALRPPFQSKPDRSKDRCRTGYAPMGASDIRAYSGLSGEDPVVSVFLPTKPATTGHLMTAEVTLDRLGALALAAGYTPERLAAITACYRN